MPDSISVSKVIGDIYESSYKPDNWPIALKGIASFTHSCSAALVYQDNELTRACGTYTYNLSAEFMGNPGTVYLLATSAYTCSDHILLHGGKQWPGWREL
jgi:hypothetical protein